MAIPNPYNVEFVEGGLLIDQIPSAIVMNKATAQIVSSWLFSVADCSGGMRNSDSAFMYFGTSEPAIINMFDVGTAGPNVKINDPPSAGYVSNEDALNLAVWVAFYGADAAVSGRGLEDGEGLKERPEVWIVVEEICADVANQRG